MFSPLRPTNKLCKASWVVECFPAVCRDKTAGVQRGIVLSLVRIPLVTFVTRDGVWGLQTWPPEPLSLTLFSLAPIPPYICVCMHWHSAFQSRCCLILCRDEVVWARPDLKLSQSEPDLVFQSAFRAMHCRFLRGSLGFLRLNQNVWAPAFLGKEQSIP